MEVSLLLKAILSLIFVIGLMFVSLWILRHCYEYLSKNKILNKLSDKNRIKIVETRRIDAKNLVVLVSCDDREYLLAIASNSISILSDNKIKKEVKKDEK